MASGPGRIGVPPGPYEVGQRRYACHASAPHWRTYTQPEQLSRARGFFHVAGLAAYGPEDFRAFVESIGDLTVTLSSLVEREGLDTEEAGNVATVTVAAIRGLLLQEVLTPGTRPEDAVTLILCMKKGRPPDPRSHPER